MGTKGRCRESDRLHRTRHNLLTHPIRRRVLDFLSEAGPRTANDLASLVGRSKNLVAFHLKRLEAAKLVVRYEDDRAHVFARRPSEHHLAREILHRATLLSATHSVRAALVEFLTQWQSATSKDLVAYARRQVPEGEPNSRVVEYHLGVLERERIVRRKKRGRFVYFTLLRD